MMPDIGRNCGRSAAGCSKGATIAAAAHQPWRRERVVMAYAWLPLVAPTDDSVAENHQPIRESRAFLFSF
jgi:hypothetical protein